MIGPRINSPVEPASLQYQLSRYDLEIKTLTELINARVGWMLVIHSFSFAIFANRGGTDTASLMLKFIVIVVGAVSASMVLATIVLTLVRMRERDAKRAQLIQQMRSWGYAHVSLVINGGWLHQIMGGTPIALATLLLVSWLAIGGVMYPSLSKALAPSATAGAPSGQPVACNPSTLNAGSPLPREVVPREPTPELAPQSPHEGGGLNLTPSTPPSRPAGSG